MPNTRPSSRIASEIDALAEQPEAHLDALAAQVEARIDALSAEPLARVAALLRKGRKLPLRGK